MGIYADFIGRINADSQWMVRINVCGCLSQYVVCAFKNYENWTAILGNV